MNSQNFLPNDAETTAIVDAFRRLQEDPALQTEARANPEGALDRLGLSGIARHAVAAGLMVALAGAAAVRPSGWWFNG